jgi:membrane protein
MNTLKEKLAAFQRSRVGLFLKKFGDDQATNLASLLAWGTLSTLLPLLLGILTLAGLVLRDPERLDQVYSTLTYLVPQQAAGPLSTALESIRRTAGAGVGIIGLLLLLYNGSRFFANMESIFNQAFHVNDRNIIFKTLVSILMLIITTALLVVSIVALGLGGMMDTITSVVGIGPIVGRVVTWSISILCAVVLFLLLYRVMPNKSQTWGQALPGALAATVLFFVISLVFPLYVALFPPNQAYAVFGIFLVFTFFLYLLGIVFVFGAELNAFLQEPARSVALAEASEQARHGKADYNQRTGEVQAETRGAAPALSGSEGSPSAQMARNEQGGAEQQGEVRRGVLGRPIREPERQYAGSASQSTATRARSGGGFASRLVGLVGLVLAVLLLRGRTIPEQDQARP